MNATHTSPRMQATSNPEDGMSRTFSDAMIEETIAVDLGQPIDISIENQRGEVAVRGADRDDVLIRAEKHGNSSSVAYQEAVLLIDTGAGKISVSPILPGSSGKSRSVSVDLGLDIGADFLRDLLDPDQPRSERRERKSRGFSVSWDNSVSYEIEVEVPRRLETRLTVSTSSGDIEIREIGGRLNLHTASGDVALRQISGDVMVNTASGDLHFERLTGSIDGRTASGDARIEQAALQRFSFQTASGDVSLDAALNGNGPYQIKTVSGDCQLALAGLEPATGAERGLTVAFKSLSGHARLGDEFQVRGSGKWETVGAVSGPHLAVTTVSGDLRGALGASSGATDLARQTGAQAGRPSAPPSAPVAGHPALPPAPIPPPVPEVPPIPVVPPADTFASGSAPDEERGSVHTGGPAAPSQPMAEADRLALLEAVERGEVDIEEALRQLDDHADEPSEPA